MVFKFESKFPIAQQPEDLFTDLWNGKKKGIRVDRIGPLCT